MKRHPLRWIVLLLVALAAGVLIRHLNRPKPIAVNLRPVERGTVERTVANTRAGTVKACRRAKLSPSVGGQIAQLPIREGDAVKAGQLLLELWNADLVAEVDFAERELEAARARARAACLNADVAQREADRLLKLRSTGAASEDRTDKAVTEAKALRAECSATRSSVERSQARIGVVRANLSRTRLVAPFDGVVAEINGELSEFVTPSPIGIPTPPAVDLLDNSCFYVTAPIDEVDAPAISVGQTARVTLDAFGNRQFAGSVRRMADFVLDREKQARTVNVEVEFTRTEDIRQLLAGYSADVEIILEARQNVLRIPTEAVLDGTRVFVYLPGPQILEQRMIKTGISNWNYTEILSGLSVNEQVVVNADRTGIQDGARAMPAGETS